jgi:hypothetical protein
MIILLCENAKRYFFFIVIAVYMQVLYYLRVSQNTLLVILIKHRFLALVIHILFMTING